MVEARLEMEYQKRIREKELAESKEKRARQAVYQAKFEEDMTRFAETGFLEVPLNRPSDVSLESIDLDADDQNLESFLKEDVPNLSPLPRDEVPVVMEGRISDQEPVTVNIQTPSEPGSL